MTQKIKVSMLLLLGIPDVVSKNIMDSKRFVLIMSKNVTTDPICIWATEIAIEQAISGQHKLKQLISIYPRDKTKVCTFSLFVSPTKINWDLSSWKFTF